MYLLALKLLVSFYNVAIAGTIVSFEMLRMLPSFSSK